MIAFAITAKHVEQAFNAPTIAEIIAIALQAKDFALATCAINQALILCADHELNPSTFVARIAASTHANLGACLTAALSIMSGSLHGGACNRVEQWVASITTPNQLERLLNEYDRCNEPIPGFGHMFYMQQDPRADFLLSIVQHCHHQDEQLQMLLSMIEPIRKLRNESPTVDFGLVALCFALGLPKGSALALFALGRAAGWFAHIFEQRNANFIVRPRAKPHL